MQRLGRIGAIACGLVLVATTAHADPFTLGDHGRASSGGGASWFNNLIKLDDALFGGGSLFLTNATISFGGQSITVPSATLSFSAPAGSSGAFSPGHSFGAPGHAFAGGNFFFGGGAFNNQSGNSQGESGGSQAFVNNNQSSNGGGGGGSQVPGANLAYNPFNPDLGNSAGSSVTGGTIRLTLANGSTANITASGVGLASASVPTNPEPSSLLLLATGLGVFFLWKKKDALKSTMA